MNLRKLLLASVLTLFTVCVYAAPVDPARAINVAEQFMPAQQVAPKPGKAQAPAQQQTPEIVYTHFMPKSGKPAIYVINISGGFALVSADDVAHPVLGYNYGKPWPTDVDSLAPSVKGFLDDLAAQMEAASEHPQDSETAAEWQEPRHAPNRAPRRVKMDNNLPDSVGPLLTTTWDQGQYYNALCPEDSQSQYDGHCPTGCVATAMAQIIKYWEYPTHGYGVHSYEVMGNTYGTLTVNYESTTYDYAHMPDILTSESNKEDINAVATLMYHCGVANVMNYEANSSGAQAENIRSAFINHFGYSTKLGYADRHMYTEEEWISLLQNEVYKGNPVYYTGTSGIVSHAFVLDGYKKDGFFHFNFGWSGSGDGWYLTSAISPSLEFNYWQQALVGIRPGRDENAVLCNYSPTGNNIDDYIIESREYYTISASLHLYNLSAKNEFEMSYDNSGSIFPKTLYLTPANSSGQLVLDIQNLDMDHAIIVYDGANKDSLVAVLEPRGIGWPYAQLPDDPALQEHITNDFSPIVSTKHGFTLMAYCTGLIENEFHLIVSDASACRMVSNIESSRESNGYRLNWSNNGAVSQWQVAWLDSVVLCDTTTYFIKESLLRDNFEVKIRSVCGLNTYSDWNTIILNRKRYWQDFVEEQPSGFVVSGDTVKISSAEGLAWLARQCEGHGFRENVNSKIIQIEDDIDLGAHLWKPIWYYYGSLYGQGHIINNLRTGYNEGGSGLFSNFNGETISDIHFNNATIHGNGGCGSIASLIKHTTVINSSSVNYVVRSKESIAGGLFGTTEYSKISNCYAVGEMYSEIINGGIVGMNRYSNFSNCYSSQGPSFQWQSCNSDIFGPGLLSGIDYGGNYYNCYADIENTTRQWNPEYDSIATLYYFFGFSNGHGIQIESAKNIATFRVVGDSIGRIIQDTAVNYLFNEKVDLLTALNHKVIEQNSSDWRMWMWDSTLHRPVLGDYYEPTCPNVSDITANNIKYNDCFAVALTWQEIGDAQEWQIKYLCEDNSENDAVVYSVYKTNDTLRGLQLGKDYTFYVRPICEGVDTVGWGQPIKLFVDKAYWKDVVTERPEGYIVLGGGNVEISSAEGLAWLINHYYGNGIVSITKDLDMGAYRWTPLYCDYTIEGNNHVISNLICRESSFSENSREVGFVKAIWNGTIRNLIIKDGIFYGSESVGGITGAIYGGAIDNCHVINSQLSGRSYVGGLGGTVGSWDTFVIQNSSASGIIYADQSVGGLFGSVQSNIAYITNCYASCDISALGKLTLHSRGGLTGYTSAQLINCYSAGAIEFDNENYYNSTGLSIGRLEINTEMRYVYALQYDTLPFEGRTDLIVPYQRMMSDTAKFDNTGLLNTQVNIDGTSYTDLLSALNAWVDANNSEGKYRRWVADTENINGGFPIFYTTPKYEITFKNEDGTILQTNTLEEGEMPVAPEVPAKESTARYTYTFAGWDHAIAPATGNDTYIAVFTPQLRSYTITFLDEDGSVLESSVWDHGCMASITTEPTKAATAQYTYTFAGWDRPIELVSRDTSYTATYTATVNKYLITFADEDGTPIVAQEYKYGATPVAPANPAKDATAQYTYSFAGWDSEIVAVTGAATYTATYTATVNKYLITFANEDGTPIVAEEYEYGSMPVAPAAPTKEATAQYTYTFAGWDKEIVAVTDAATYTATYTATINKYLITFADEDGTPIVSKEYEYGSTPVAPAAPTKEATAQYTYTFAGWDKEIVAVTGAATYSATYTATVNKYLITFLNDDESILCAEEWEYGATPSCEEPTKEADGQYSYSFAGWQPEVVAVTGIATYTATYNALSNPTALPTNEQSSHPIKVIENGNIFILRDGKTYTLQGQEVR